MAESLHQSQHITTGGGEAVAAGPRNFFDACFSEQRESFTMPSSSQSNCWGDVWRNMDLGVTFFPAPEARRKADRGA